MTELSFLISLLLNEKLPLELKQLVAERIKEVESRLQQPIVPRGTSENPIGPGVSSGIVAQQSPSMQRAVEEMNLISSHAPIVAATPAAAAAIQQRQQIIQRATSNKPEAGRTSPRKF